MTNKKLLAFAMALLLLCSTITACGKKDVAEDEPISIEETISASDESTTEEPTIEPESTTLTTAAESAAQPSTSKTSTQSAKSPNSGKGNNKDSNTPKTPQSPKDPESPKTPVDKTPPQQPETPAKQITRADLEALIPRWRAYGESLGMKWDDSFSIEAQNACWSTGQPVFGDTNLEELYNKVCKEINRYYTGNAHAKYFKVIIVDENGSSLKWSTCVLWM